MSNGWSASSQLRGKSSRVTLSSFQAMNPDKLFDYLEGRLSATERAALEERLISDRQLQRQLVVARQIHAGMRGDSREVLLPPDPDVAERGSKLALRIGVAFIVLMGLNVAFGLWLIFNHETSNPNRPLLENQLREQIAKSIERASASFTPDPNALGIVEITVPAANGKSGVIADEVVGIASRFGGSATKGVEDAGRISVLVDVPPDREQEFRRAIEALRAVPASSMLDTAPEPRSAPSATAEKKSFVVQIIEQPARSH